MLDSKLRERTSAEDALFRALIKIRDDDVIARGFSLVLRREDFYVLCDGSWPKKDEIMNVYLSLIWQRHSVLPAEWVAARAAALAAGVAAAADLPPTITPSFVCDAFL